MRERKKRMTTALVTVTPGSLTRADQNPVAVYLGRLGKGSRSTMLTALGNMALLLGSAKSATKPERDAAAMTCHWWELRFQHTQRLRQLMIEQGMAPATLNRHLAALRAVLKDCWRLQLMSAEDHARAADVHDVKNNRLPAGRMLKPEEVVALFGAVKSKRDAAILAVMYAAGLRRAEIVALDVADVIDDEGGAIRVRHGKGDKEREIPLSDGMREIRAHLKERGRKPGALFLNQHGRRLTAQAIAYILGEIGGTAGVRDVSPHDLRRTFGSVAIDNSKDVFSVQTMMGHSNSDTTKRYDRRGKKALRNVADGIKIPRGEK